MSRKRINVRVITFAESLMLFFCFLRYICLGFDYCLVAIMF